MKQATGLGRIWLNWGPAWCGVVLVLLCGLVHAERYAVLVGIDYKHTERIPDLDGPVPDVQAMQKVLVQKWGFRKNHITTLINQEASKDRIMAALRGLLTKTATGDHIFIYFSGHGTSFCDAETQLPLPHTSGAFVPADFKLSKDPQKMIQRLIVGRHDLLPEFSKLDRDRHVFVVMDSCFSEHSTRSLVQRVTRHAPIANLRHGSDTLACKVKSGPQRYPYRNLYSLAAASEYEKALDITQWDLDEGLYSTIDGKPHGALSDSLLRVLHGKTKGDSNNDGILSYNELYYAVRGDMQEKGYNHTPHGQPRGQDDRIQLGAQAVFSHRPPAQPLWQPDTLLRVMVTSDQPTTRGAKRVRDTEKAERYLSVKALRKALAQEAQIALVEHEPNLVVVIEGKQVSLQSPSAELITRLPARRAEVVRRIGQQARIERLARLRYPQQQFNVSLDLSDGRQGTTLVAGERFGFTITTEQDAYLLLIDLDSQGGINVIYPFYQRELRRHSHAKPIQMADMIEVIEPYGTDYLKLIAFQDEPPELRALVGQEFKADSPKQSDLWNLLKRSDGKRAQITLKIVTTPRRK